MKLKWAVPLVFLLVLVLRLSGVAQNYAPVTNYPTGTAPIGLAQGDFNEDGRPDIAVANVSGGSISILPGNGDGTFGPATAVLTGSNPYSIASADLNGDGHLDLVVSFTSGQDFAVLFGKGNGQFQAPNTLAISGLPVGTTVGQVVVKDLNGDGKPDLVFATDRGIAVFVNSGTGSFTQANSVDSANVIANVAVVDLDQDGILDLVATESTVDINGNPTGSLVYALGHGDGTFAPVVNITDLTGPPTGLAVADLNHDGFLDIVASFAASTTGTGGPPTKPNPCPTPRICLPQDGGTGSIPVPGGIAKVLQTAKLQFSTTGRIVGDQNPGFLVIGDLDGDGNPDVAEASNNQPAVVVFRGNGDGTFGLPKSLSIPSIAFEIATGSFTQTSALDLFASDNATNQVSVFVNQGANTLSMVSSVNPSALFQQVTLTATVQPKFPNAGTLSGSVTFADSGTTLGSAAVNPSGISTLSTTFNTTGDHQLTAVYGGNSSFVGGTSAQLVQHVAVAPNITLSSSLNPSVVGQAVDFTVVVTAGGTGPAPTGTVTLLSSGAPLVSGTVDASGRAVLATTSLPVGSNNLIAQYSGDSNYPGEQSAQLVQVVNKSNSNTVLTSSANPSVFGQPVNVVVTVSASSASGRTPSGNVTLKDAGSAIGAAVLDNAGSALITLSNLAAGTHSLTLDYAGDSNFNASTSATLSQVVTTVSTSTSLSSSPNPSGVGQTVTLTALVKSAFGTAASGVVAFNDGATLLGSANLDGTGTAVLAVTSLAVGSHNLSAAYAGNPGFRSSTSAVLTQVVSSSVVKIVFNSSVNPAAFGQSVSLTATISAASPGTNKIPTGSVSFLDGATVLGQAPIDNAGNAVFTAASLSVGTHTLSVSYSGDSNFSSGSASLSEVINKASTSTALSSSLNPATNASAVLLHATVMSTAGPASGSVQFFDGAVQVGSSVLDASGSASLALSNLGIGTHVLTAAYVGSPNLANSTSSINETVIDSHSHVLLASSANPQTFSQPVTFAATVTPALTSQVVSGTIVFRDGTQVLTTVPVNNGAAIFSTTHLSVGTHVITAAYQASAGPGPFDGSSAPLAEVIQASNAPDYTVSIKPGYGSVVPGAVFYTAVTVAPLNGFSGVVTLGCAGLPANAVCVFQPAQVAMNGQVSTVSHLEIVTTGPYVAPGPTKPSYPLPRPSPAMWLMPSLLGCVLVGGRKRSRAAVGLCIVACVMMIGCGGSSKSFDQPHVYNVTVSASSGTVLHSATLQLTLQ